MKSVKNSSCTDGSLSQADLQNLQNQLLYKDNRICELSNEILSKEQEILDLQELCYEKDRMAAAKNEAMRLLQYRIMMFDNKEVKEIGTETDSTLWSDSRNKSTKTPGHVVIRGYSPPPLDPSEYDEEQTLNTQSQLGDVDDSILARKQKKRVTFDLPPRESRLTSSEQGPEILRLIEESESLQARFKAAHELWEKEKAELQSCVTEKENALRDAKHAALKSRAVAQSKIRELQEASAEVNSNASKRIDSLLFEIDSLRSSRDWEVKNNGVLKEEINEIRAKISQITIELDGSEKNNRELQRKLKTSNETNDSVMVELLDAESLVVLMEEQKNDILDDVDRLKDALKAQDSLIDLLEADVVIYEEHIGILRESLGASKVDHRSILRSRAFETKLNALELEKEQFSRRSHEDKIKSNTLKKRIEVLEEENEKLVEKLCEAEMLLRDQHEIEKMNMELKNNLLQRELSCTQVKKLAAAEVIRESVPKENDISFAQNDTYAHDERSHPYHEQDVQNETLVVSNDDGLVAESCAHPNVQDPIKDEPNIQSEMKCESTKQVMECTEQHSDTQKMEFTRLVSENIILRQCVDDSVRTQNDVYEDLEKLCDLKSELETAVNALKGEVWSLNKQLKTSHQECSSLREKRDQLENDQLKDQEALTCLRLEISKISSESKAIQNEQRVMKKELEAITEVAEERKSHNDEMKSAYQLLNDYYEDLQSAYNELYAKHSQSLQSENFDAIMDTLIDRSQVVEENQAGLNKTETICNYISVLKAENTTLHETISEFKGINRALFERVSMEEKMSEERAKETDPYVTSIKEEILHLTETNKKLLFELENERSVNKTDDQLLNRQKIDLEILNAKLITKQTNLDSLLRANSELAYTNAHLQEEVDEMKRVVLDFEKNAEPCSEYTDDFVKCSEPAGDEEDYSHVAQEQPPFVEQTEQAGTPHIESSGLEKTCENDLNVTSCSDMGVCKALRDANEILFSGRLMDLNESDLENNCGVDKLGLEIKSFIKTCSTHITSLMEENAQLSQQNKSSLLHLEELIVQKQEIEAQVCELKKELLNSQEVSVDDIETTKDFEMRVRQLEKQNDLLQRSESALLKVVDDLTKKLETKDKKTKPVPVTVAESSGSSCSSNQKPKTLPGKVKQLLNDDVDVGDSTRPMTVGTCSLFNVDEKCRKRVATSKK